MMQDETHKTPEGFQLYRPLLMPDARDFSDVLTAERAWDFATMNHKNGYPQAETPQDITREGFEKVISRFCAVRNLPGRTHLQVSPAPALEELIFSLDPEPFAFFDRVGFEAIYHKSNDRVLIVGSASQIIASRYIAYVDPATVPEM